MRAGRESSPNIISRVPIRARPMRLPYMAIRPGYLPPSSRWGAMRSCATMRCAWRRSYARWDARSSSRSGRACRTCGTCSRPSCRKRAGPSPASAASCRAGGEESQRRCRNSRSKNRRAGGFPALEIAVGLHRILQRVLLVDRDLHRTACHDREQIVGGGKEILALGRMGNEGGPGDVERALLRENAEIERLDRPRRIAEAHEQAERTQAIERARERRFADSVIDHRAQLALGDLLDACDEIFLVVEDHVMTAVSFGELGLLLGAHCAAHVGAEVVCP